MGRFRFSRYVMPDVTEIRDYIGRDDEAAAIRMVEQLSSAFEMLGDQPGAGSKREDLRGSLRSWPVGTYRIIYRPAPLPITIVRVVSSYRDLKNIEMDI